MCCAEFFGVSGVGSKQTFSTPTDYHLQNAVKRPVNQKVHPALSGLLISQNQKLAEEHSTINNLRFNLQIHTQNPLYVSNPNLNSSSDARSHAESIDRIRTGRRDLLEQRLMIASSKARQLMGHQELDVRYLDDDSLLELSKSSKVQAIYLQMLLDQNDPQVNARLSRFAAKYIQLLINCKIGNYFVQNLIEICPSFRSFASAWCKQRFLKLCRDIYSSRVIQKLIESCPEMCSFALKVFSDNLDQYMLEFPIVCLVISSIRCSSSDEEKKQIVNNLMRNPKRWLTKKYHKRVLAACLNFSTKAVLDTIVPGLLMNRRVVDFLANRSLY